MKLTSLNALWTSMRLQSANAPEFRRILSSGAWLVADKISRLAIALLVNLWVARYLGPAQYGAITFAVSLMSFFYAAAALGLDQILVQELVRGSAQKNEVMGTAALVRTATGIAACVGMMITAAVLQQRTEPARTVSEIVSLTLIFNGAAVFEFWFISQYASRFSALAANLAALAGAGARVVMILSGAGIIAFAWVLVLEAALGALFSALFYLRSRGPVMGWRFRSKLALDLLTAAWPYLITTFFTAISMRTDTLFIERMLGHSALGIYAAAVRLTELWYFLPQVAVSSVAPAIARLKASNSLDYNRRMRQLFSLLIAASLIIAVSMTFAARPLIALAYGAQYAAAAPVLQIYAWASVFNFLGWAAIPWFTNEGLGPVLLRNTAMGAVANIGLNFVLVPYLGLIGSAVATIVSYALSYFLCNALSARTRPMFALQVEAFLMLPVWTR